MYEYVNKNRSTITIDEQHYRQKQLQITGNENQIYIKYYTCNIVIHGNKNIVRTIQSKVKMELVGNANHIQAVKSQFRLRVRGNSNIIKEIAPKYQLQVYDSKGFSNQYPNNTIYKYGKYGMPNFDQQWYQSSGYQNPLIRQENKIGKSFSNQRMQIQIPDNQDASNYYRKVKAVFSPSSSSSAFSRENPSQYLSFPRQILSGPIKQTSPFRLISLNDKRFQNLRGLTNKNAPTNNQVSFFHKILPQNNLKPIQRNQLFRSIFERSIFKDRNSSQHIQRKQKTTLSQQPLTSNEMARIPRHSHYGKRQECSICYLQILTNEEQSFLFCAHNYHTACIQNWFKKSSKCPICNQNVRKAF